MEITTTQDGATVVFRITGDIDENGAELLKSQFTKLNFSIIKEVIIDFSKVTYIGSTGIGKLMLFYKNLAVHGGNIRIENISPQIYELFQELKLDTILTLSQAI